MPSDLQPTQSPGMARGFFFTKDSKTHGSRSLASLVSFRLCGRTRSPDSLHGGSRDRCNCRPALPITAYASRVGCRFEPEAHERAQSVYAQRAIKPAISREFSQAVEPAAATLGPCSVASAVPTEHTPATQASEAQLTLSLIHI